MPSSDTKKRDKKAKKLKAKDRYSAGFSNGGGRSLIDQMRDNLTRFQTSSSGQTPAKSYLKVIVTKTGQGLQLTQAIPVKQPIYDDWGQEIVRTSQPVASSSVSFVQLPQRPTTTTYQLQTATTSTAEPGSHSDFLDEVIKELSPDKSSNSMVNITEQGGPDVILHGVAATEATHHLVYEVPDCQSRADEVELGLGGETQATSVQSFYIHQTTKQQKQKMAKGQLSKAQKMSCKFCPSCGQTVPKPSAPIDLTALVDNAIGGQGGLDTSRSTNFHLTRCSSPSSDEDTSTGDDSTSDDDDQARRNNTQSLPLDNEFLKKQFPYGVHDYGEYIRVKACHPCKYCTQIFDRESTFLVHKNCVKQRIREKLGDAVADSGLFTCEYCRKEYKDIRGLHKHIAYHLDKTFVCKKCPVAFVDGDKANRHILTRKHRKMLPAHNGQFVNLKAGYKVDTATRPRDYKCSQCAAALTTADGLELHMERHYG